MFLNSKLNFDEHIQGTPDKTSKSINIICKFQNFLPRSPRLHIYKSFVRPYLDYGGSICDKTFTGSF